MFTNDNELGATGDSTTDVTVVIPCYNAEAWIAKSVDSVLAQSGVRVELIVVDDGSVDRSVEILHGYGDQITLEAGPNRGACHARNRGLALSTARYVLFLDADDYLEGDILAGAFTRAIATSADLVLSNMHLEHPGGVREARDRYSGTVTPQTFFVRWLRGDYVNPSAMLWRAGFACRIGGWDETLRRNQDFDITMRAILDGARIEKNDNGRAIYVLGHHGSISRSDSWDNTESRLRAHIRLLEKTAGTEFEKHSHLLYEHIYWIARTAFENGHLDLGRKAMDVLRARGCTRHHGTFSHRVMAGVLGLERKIRLRKAMAMRHTDARLGTSS